jgi:hypothetical protein
MSPCRRAGLRRIECQPDAAGVSIRIVAPNVSEGTLRSQPSQLVPRSTVVNCAWSPLALGTGKMNDLPIAPAVNAFSV